MPRPLAIASGFCVTLTGCAAENAEHQAPVTGPYTSPWLILAAGGIALWYFGYLFLRPDKIPWRSGRTPEDWVVGWARIAVFAYAVVAAVFVLIGVWMLFHGLG